MKARILIVEDELLIAEDIRRVLVGYGYDVIGVASNGPEALRLVAKGVPDLALMDIKLGGAWGGIETAQRIVEQHHLPIVYVTAHSDEATLERAKSTHPYGYVLKPFTDRELRTSIEIALSTHDMETHLAERERWFSTTLASIGDAVIATDADERIKFMNGAAEALTGWDARDATDHPVDEVLRVREPRTDVPVASPITHALRERRPVTLPARVELVDKGGARHLIDDCASPIVGDDGAVLGSVVVFRDVTERARIERRLALSERLASVGTMVAGIAHEINNPLAYVLGNLEFALAQLEGAGGASSGARPDAAWADTMREALRDAATGAERVRAIVQTLHRFSRADETRKARLDLRAVLDASTRMVENALRHHARLEVAYDSVPEVDANEGQLVQVFANVLVNAYQSMSPGSAGSNCITIRTRTDAAGRAVVEIRDTGSGIAPDDLERVFDPFFTTKDVGQGSGLGLAICHSIVTELGGSIELESKRGSGTLVRIVLPAASGDAAEPNAPARADVAPAARRLRVVVVDDEPAIATTIERLLHDDHEVTTFTDAHAAVQHLARAEWDVVLCDLMMPNVTGMELHELLSRANPAAAARVVFMTGGAFSPAADAFLRRVRNTTLHKPFTAAALREALATFARR